MSNRSSTSIELLHSPKEKRAYRVVILPNGITALLISETPEDKKVGGFTKEELMDGEAAVALCVGVGSFSDPLELPGWAHFMEHMVFMGSKKYPKENYWDDFLAKHRGESNAFTECEMTTFNFTVEQEMLTKACDIWAQFFIAPLFSKDSVDREIMAVDNECQMFASNDFERANVVIAAEVVEKGHPMQRFTIGNKKSLKDDPEKLNIDIYEQLHTFFARMYSAHYMKLVVHSMDHLDVIEKHVVKIFSKIPNNGVPRPKHLKAPFQEKTFNKVIRIVPNEDINKIDIMWPLPPLLDDYRARVVEFLSVLLGHGGQGSILSVLRRRHLATEMEGGNDQSGFHNNYMWTAFIVTVNLTESGMANYEQVLELIYQYISILRNEIPAYVFEEQRNIEETKYILEEQDIDVEELAGNMHLFPPEHYLCGRDLYFEYNEQLIRDCLDCLKPQGMLIMLFNKAFNNLYGLKQEPWLNVKYTSTDMDPRLISKLNKVCPIPELKVPRPNPYIATNFNLVKIKKSTKHPIVIYDQKGCRMWFKKDTIYQSENVFLYFNFMSCAVFKNEANFALTDIILTIIREELTEALFSATLAGYEYSVDWTPEGVVLFVGGYSEKINLVIEDTLNTLKKLKIDKEAFKSVVNQVKKAYINELIKPKELSSAVRYSILEMNDPSVLKRYEQIESITLPIVEEFLEEFYKTLFIESFVTGNITPKNAIEIAEKACTVIKKALPEDQLVKPTVKELPVGDTKCFMSSINPEDTNSCVIQYFQQGPGTILNMCLNDILVQAMSEPLFNSLRTEKQLAYSVYCDKSNIQGILGFIIVVESQANRFKMKEVEGHINEFLEEFCALVKKMPEDELMEIVEDQAVQRTFVEFDLHEQSEVFWDEILKKTYIFDRSQRELTEFDEKITRDEIINWCDALISPERRKLSIMVEGCSKSNCNYATGEASLKTISELIKGIKSCKGGSNSKVKVPKFQNLGDNFITNLCEFKSSLKTLDHHIITH